MCTQQRLKPARASVQSDHSLEFASLHFQNAPNEESDQTVWNHRLIWIFNSYVQRYNIWCYSSYIQSTLITSNSKGLSEILRDIRTSTYQICRIEEKITWTTTFNKCIRNWTLEVEIYWKYCGKKEKLLLRSNFSSFPQYFFNSLDFHV